MSFMDSYKHLEKLCGEVLNDDRRISAYIDIMLNTPFGEYAVPSWKNDLKQLKHYRWVRNKIVHEPNCTESNMCVSGDAEWLDAFSERILNQTDPLAVYYRSKKSHSSQKTKQNRRPAPHDVRTYRRQSRPENRDRFLVNLIVTAVTVLLVLIICYFINLS